MHRPDNQKNVKTDAVINDEDRQGLRKTGWALLGLSVIGAFFYALGYLTNPPIPFSVNPEERIRYCEDNCEAPLKTIIANKDNESDNKQNARQKKNAEHEIVRRSDLAAQRGMWRATNIVALVAFWQLIATFIGLYWIGRTMTATGAMLVQTSETLNQAKIATSHAFDTAMQAKRASDAAENAERAHMHVTYSVAANVSGPDKHSIEIEASLKNFGNTPATISHRSSKWEHIEFPDDQWAIHLDDPDVEAAITGQSHVSAGSEHEPSKRMNIAIRGFVGYREYVGTKSFCHVFESWSFNDVNGVAHDVITRTDFYFRIIQERTNFIGKQVNETFDDNDTVRWETRIHATRINGIAQTVRNNISDTDKWVSQTLEKT